MNDAKDHTMTLSKGVFIRLIHVDYSKAFSVDWLGERDAVPGDIALVEDVFETGSGPGVRLLCEPRPGFLEWRADFDLSHLRYDVIAGQP